MESFNSNRFSLWEQNFLSNGLRFMNVHFMFFKAGFLAADMGFAIKLVGMTQ